MRPPDHSGPLELHEARQLTSCEATGKALDAVVFCLGFGKPPLPTLLGAAGDELPRPSSHTVPGGALLDPVGQPIPGLFGVGLGFSDSEFTSGNAYAEAGFAPFAARAAEIADAVAQSAPVQTQTETHGRASSPSAAASILRALS